MKFMMAGTIEFVAQVTMGGSLMIAAPAFSQDSDYGRSGYYLGVSVVGAS